MNMMISIWICLGLLSRKVFRQFAADTVDTVDEV